MFLKLLSKFCYVAYVQRLYLNQIINLLNIASQKSMMKQFYSQLK